MTEYAYNYDIIRRIEARGYRVWHDGQQWRASGPRELMAPTLAALLKAVKQR